MQKPHRHWMVWPFKLEGRFYRWPEPPIWVDAEGITWFLILSSAPVSWVEQRLRSGRVGIDVGAHRGYWAMSHASFFSSETKVLLVEPNPSNFGYLLQNMAHNRFVHGLPLPLALWSAPGMLTLRVPLQGSFALYSSYLARVDTTSAHEEALRVPATTIDALVSLLGLERVDWIKIDAEGAEVAILQGARQTLTRFSPSLWMEVHNTWEKVLSLLHELGYTVRDQIRLEDPESLYPSNGLLWAEKNDTATVC